MSGLNFQKNPIFGDVNVNEFSKQSRISILGNWMESHDLRRVDGDSPTHLNHVLKRWSHLDAAMCHDTEHLDVFTLTEQRTGYAKVSDHLPIITKIYMDIESINEDKERESEENYQGDRWSLDRSKLGVVNERIGELLGTILEKIPREETELRLRTTIVGIRDVFNNMMPKKMKKRQKGKFGSKIEKKLKSQLKKLNKNKKQVMKLPVRGPNIAKKLGMEQIKILTELREIYQRRKTMQVQKTRRNIQLTLCRKMKIVKMT